MKKIFVIIVVALLLGLVLYIPFILLQDTFESIPETNDTSVEQFPTSQEKINNSFDDGKISIFNKDGSLKIITGNFNFEDVQTVSEGFYILFEPKTQSEADAFDIYYDEVNGTLLVTLHQEPIKLAREAAIKQLVDKLNTTTSELCDLNLSIITNSYVNTQYSGYELGVPGCPGAAELP